MQFPRSCGMIPYGTIDCKQRSGATRSFAFRKGDPVAKRSGSIAEQAERLAAPFAQALGLSLWDVRFVKEGAEWYLRFFIDKEGGVTIEDCEALSRAVDGPLDEADWIEQSYYLEVSSPGLNRELTKPAHFEQMKGQPVLVRLYRPMDGVKDLQGVLLDRTDGTLTIEINGAAVCLPQGDVATVKLDDDHFEPDDMDA